MLGLKKLILMILEIFFIKNKIKSKAAFQYESILKKKLALVLKLCDKTIILHSFVPAFFKTIFKIF
uniref:Uncharacterized protein n=1 Tax=Chroomonas placoidea TaxID=173977 RepID=A0A2P1G812_9CRYP|nr:hypothetical protein CplaMt_p011 [Chroomonas placoidea]AVM81090.1 hypothetical protein CplaMt_p011 [Chroomonas placoidea]